MSDQSQGPGWWQASDGKWYPPEQAAPVPPVAPTQPFGAPMPTPGPPAGVPSAAPGSVAAPAGAPRSGLGTGPIIGIVVAAVAIIAAVVFFATKDDGNKSNAAATQSSSPSSSSSSSSKSSSSTKSSSGGAPNINAPSGFKVFSNDQDKFAVAIPSSLQILDLTSGDIDQLIQQLGANNPALQKLGPQIKQIFASGGKLFAIDTSASGGFNDNLNVIATPGSVDVTSAAAKSQAEQQLTSIGATNVQFEVLNAHNRKILASSYQASVTTADGTPLTFFGRQAVVAAGGKIWFITFSTSADSADVFKTIAQTFDVNG